MEEHRLLTHSSKSQVWQETIVSGREEPAMVVEQLLLNIFISLNLAQNVVVQSLLCPHSNQRGNQQPATDLHFQALMYLSPPFFSPPALIFC